MKARKNRLRAIIKNLRSELRAAREVISYHQRVIAELRKQITDLCAAKEGELDKAINRLHVVASAMYETAAQERERIDAYNNGAHRI